MIDLFLKLLLAIFSVRTMWFAWAHYFRAAPRFPLESAAIGLVVLGAVGVLFRRQPASGADSPRPDVSPWWAAAFACLALLAYYPALGLGLLSDDYSLRALALSDGLGTHGGWYFRPVPIVLWKALLGIDRHAYALHVTNVVLHGLNGFLVFLLGARLGMRRSAAWTAALMFIVFPALPEAVAWASGIQDVLMTTFVLGTAIVWTSAAARWSRMVGACVLFALALGTKETAVCAPLLAIALLWGEGRPEKLRRWREFLPLLAVLAVYLVLRAGRGTNEGYFVPPTGYMFKQMISLGFGTLIVPFRASASAMGSARAFLMVALVVTLLTVALARLGRSTLQTWRLGAAAAWILASIAPVYSLFFVGPDLQGSRYVYLATCAWVLLLGDLLWPSSHRNGWISGMRLAVVAALGLVMVSALRSELAVWRTAADLRDRVLAEAQRVRAATGCSSPAFVGLPDSIDGAYVFRNGFGEAAAEIGGVAIGGSEQPGCTFKWADATFVLEASPK